MSSKGARRHKAPRQKPTAEQMARMLAGNVALELTTAGAQVLREEFGFTPEQAAAWIDATLAQAKGNRAGMTGEHMPRPDSEICSAIQDFKRTVHTGVV